jgi:hypothetical protein
MKDVYEIFRLSEIELAKVKTEVEALGIVARSFRMRETSALTARGPRPVGLRCLGLSRCPRELMPIGSRPGVEDENRGFPITARDVLPAADSSKNRSTESLLRGGP